MPLTFTKGSSWAREYLFILIAVLHIDATITSILVVSRTLTWHSLTYATEYVSTRNPFLGFTREPELIKVGEHRIKRITGGNQLPTKGDI